MVLNFFYSNFDAERNWNMTLPGFGGDEIKTFKKPVRIFVMTGHKQSSNCGDVDIVYFTGSFSCLRNSLFKFLGFC